MHIPEWCIRIKNVYCSLCTFFLGSCFVPSIFYSSERVLIHMIPLLTERRICISVNLYSYDITLDKKMRFSIKVASRVQIWKKTFCQNSNYFRYRFIKNGIMFMHLLRIYKKPIILSLFKIDTLNFTMYI